MTPSELRDQIVAKAGQIKARSTSTTIKGWADEIVALADTIPTMAPNIIERRQGERRSVERADLPGDGDRRAARRQP